MQRHTVKLVLKKNKANQQGLAPIYLRITIDRKTSFITTSHSVHPALWDQKTETVKKPHPLCNEINSDIMSKKQEVLKGMVSHSVSGRTVNAQDVKERVLLGLARTNIFSFTDRVIAESAGKRSDNTFTNWRKHLKKLEEYEGGKEVCFEQITARYLSEFETWLRGDGVKRVRGNPNNYIHAIMKSIRRLFNVAISKKLIGADLYPFREYEIPKQTADDKEYLTLDELDKWEAYTDTVTDPLLQQAAVYFLFGCYSGLRVSDWYRFDMEKRVKDGYISLRAKKNGGWVTVPIHERMKRTLERMKRVPLTRHPVEIGDVLSDIAKEIGINKHLSSHSGRKSFAVTICLNRGISSETAATLLGITLQVFINSYSKISPAKIKAETEKAWTGL